jgi:hypothetical protein
LQQEAKRERPFLGDCKGIDGITYRFRCRLAWCDVAVVPDGRVQLLAQRGVAIDGANHPAHF